MLEDKEENINKEDEESENKSNNQGFNYTMEGYVRLARAILISAYDDYASILRRIMKVREIKNPTITDRNHLLSLLREKEIAELFYKSERFQHYSLGQYPDPNDVIKTIQKKVGYHD